MSSCEDYSGLSPLNSRWSRWVPLPPHMGGPKGGNKGPIGGDWRVIRDRVYVVLKEEEKP